mmetsp:Transcript_12256/g.35201  ORF Transcript_12256/g.35201 Transcript_12256/m.35201 type:complete len:252 (-) Transcript_12256:445-1200(-)
MARWTATCASSAAYPMAAARPPPTLTPQPRRSSSCSSRPRARRRPACSHPSTTPRRTKTPAASSSPTTPNWGPSGTNRWTTSCVRSGTTRWPGRRRCQSRGRRWNKYADTTSACRGIEPGRRCKRTRLKSPPCKPSPTTRVPRRARPWVFSPSPRAPSPAGCARAGPPPASATGPKWVSRHTPRRRCSPASRKCRTWPHHPERRIRCNGCPQRKQPRNSSRSLRKVRDRSEAGGRRSLPNTRASGVPRAAL